MKVIIAGSRTFNNYDLLTQTLQEVNLDIDEIVCGARGLILLGRMGAEE